MLPTMSHWFFFCVCSAGIGRTGTVLCCDICMQEMEHDRHVDILRAFAQMRQDRGGMVQTKDQYKFIFQVRWSRVEMFLGSQGIDLSRLDRKFDPKEGYSCIVCTHPKAISFNLPLAWKTLSTQEIEILKSFYTNWKDLCQSCERCLKRAQASFARCGYPGQRMERKGTKWPLLTVTHARLKENHVTWPNCDSDWSTQHISQVLDDQYFYHGFRKSLASDEICRLLVTKLVRAFEAKQMVELLVVCFIFVGVSAGWMLEYGNYLSSVGEKPKR